MRVELSEEAQAQVRTIDAWWRKNRPAAPDLSVTELERALTTLEETPTLGARYVVGEKSVRRLLLRRTRHHLYLSEQAGTLLVVAVWSAHRGRGPKL